MNKKILSFFISALVFSFILPNIYTARADFDITRVRGQIFGPDGQPFKHADVVVTCDGQTKNDRTNGQGKYNVLFFGRNVCDVGDTATITVNKDGVGGSASGPVQERRDGRFVDRNFSVVNLNLNVPEFGLITGAATLLTGAGAFFTLRKRKA